MLKVLALAGVQYHGEVGVTRTCVRAIARIIQSGAWISRALLLTFQDRHCFYLELAEHEHIVIRPGFASGYPGEGPAGLAISLDLLRRHGIEVDEVLVTAGFMRRASEGRLTSADMGHIDSGKVVRPARLSDYTWKVLDARGGRDACLREQFALVPNFALVDPRIFDYALTLESDPDAAISKAFRLLEETVRVRCGLPGMFGRALFERAFLKQGAPLTWRGLEPNAIKGRGELFVAAFSAFRNPRAHRHINANLSQHLREFMLVNELFLLEAEAVEVRG